jgi:rRNA maturation RNase YbeY
MAISFIENNIKFKLKNKRKIKHWITSVIHTRKKKTGSINFVFCDDEYILLTNIKYLNHNYYTDIITFDYTEQEVLHGDIFISIDTVKSNSKKYNTSFDNELNRVLIHGILHLCGLMDKSNSEKDDMRLAEDKALKLFKKFK